MATAKKLHRFYQNGRVTSELGGAVVTRSIFQHQGGLLAHCAAGVESSCSIMMVNNTNTVMAELGHTGKTQFAYTPYGRRPAEPESSTPLAFNGEPLDAPTGCYLLGNGYRLFSPRLKRFISPDNSSPFDKGGLNAYVYCASDPINRIDPTGHSFRRTALKAMTLGSAVALIAATVAVFTVKSEAAINAIGAASIILGAVGIGSALYRKRLALRDLQSRSLSEQRQTAERLRLERNRPQWPERSRLLWQERRWLLWQERSRLLWQERRWPLLQERSRPLWQELARLGYEAHHTQQGMQSPMGIAEVTQPLEPARVDLRPTYASLFDPLDSPPPYPPLNRSQVMEMTEIVTSVRT